MATNMPERPTEQLPSLSPSQIAVERIITPDLRRHIEDTLRKSVPPVHGICGHIARSEQHTCGSHSCVQQYGW